MRRLPLMVLPILLAATGCGDPNPSDDSIVVATNCDRLEPVAAVVQARLDSASRSGGYGGSFCDDDQDAVHVSVVIEPANVEANQSIRVRYQDDPGSNGDFRFRSVGLFCDQQLELWVLDEHVWNDITRPLLDDLEAAITDC